MIGNLVLALGVAFATGSVLYEPQPHRAISSSNLVINQEVESGLLSSNVYCYAKGSASFNQGDWNDSYAYRLIFGANGYYNANLINYDNPPSTNSYSMTRYTDVIQWANWQSDTINSNYVYCFIQDLGSFGVIVRICVPFDTQIGAIQIDTHNSNMNYVGMGNWMGDVNVLDEGASFIFVDNAYPIMQNDSSFKTSNYPFKFAQFYFVLNYQNFTYGQTYNFDISLYGNLNGDYNTGYANGYSAGYSSGLGDGFANGYSSGLQTASSQNASFLGLMSSIADTPIRFLRDMFSFELFGMNVAIVILSCLTAIIIFGIVKKVWK